MTKRMMANLYKGLNAIGLEFEERESRYWDKFYGESSDLSVNGFLYNRDETPITMEQLAEVLEIAKTRKTYVVIMSEMKPEKGGRVVGFLQKGLFDTVGDAIPPVTHTLRRNFSYFQEDEMVLTLDAVLQQLQEKLASFQIEANDSALLKDASARLRKVLRFEGCIIEREREIYKYMGNVIEHNQAEALCNAIHCMRLTH